MCRPGPSQLVPAIGMPFGSRSAGITQRHAMQPVNSGSPAPNTVARTVECTPSAPISRAPPARAPGGGVHKTLPLEARLEGGERAGEPADAGADDDDRVACHAPPYRTQAATCKETLMRHIWRIRLIPPGSACGPQRLIWNRAR